MRKLLENAFDERVDLKSFFSLAYLAQSAERPAFNLVVRGLIPLVDSNLLFFWRFIGF